MVLKSVLKGMVFERVTHIISESNDAGERRGWGRGGEIAQVTFLLYISQPSTGVNLTLPLLLALYNCHFLSTFTGLTKRVRKREIKREQERERWRE